MYWYLYPIGLKKLKAAWMRVTPVLGREGSQPVLWALHIAWMEQATPIFLQVIGQSTSHWENESKFDASFQRGGCGLG